MPDHPQAEPLFSELVERTEGLQPWRRVLHLVAGSGMAWVVHVLGPQSVESRWLFGGALAITFLADSLRLRSDALNRLFFRGFRALACPREAERLSLTWFLLGVFLVLWIPAEDIAVPAILVLSVADPAAGLVGRLWGAHPLAKGTLEGTLAFFVTALAVLVPFVGVWPGSIVALVVASVEVLATRWDDNVLIPVATAGCLWATTM